MIFIATKADLTCFDSETITSGMVNALTCRFVFSADWEGLGRTAVFICGKVQKDVLIGEDGTAMVPWECLEAVNIGEMLTVGVYGIDESGSIIIPTVYSKAGRVKPGTDPANDPGVEPTPTLLEQILADNAATRNKTEADKQAAETAKNEAERAATGAAGAATAAAGSASAAAESERMAGNSATAAAGSATAADASKTAAAGSASAAAESERKAGNSATAAAGSATAADASKTAAAGSASAAAESERKAGNSATAAAGSATAADASKTAAAGSATAAAGSAAAAEAAKRAAEEAAASIVVDAELSPDSENPVQNKAIAKALMDKDAIYTSLLAGGADFKATMKAFFAANGAAAMVDYSALCDRWYRLARLGWTGGVRFQLPQEGVSQPSDGTKTGDNAGLTCTPSTRSSANRDDYATIPLFAVVDANVYLDEDGRPHVSAIDGVAGNFSRTDPEKITAVMQMTGWVKYSEDAETFGYEYTDQAGAEGFAPLTEAVELADNSIREWVVHGKYPFGDGYTCCSGVKTLVWSVSHNAQLTGVRSKWGNRYCGLTTADDAFLKLMLYLKYGQLDSDRVLHGCNNYNYTYKLAAAETGVERILLKPAEAAALLVGSCICVGTSTGRTGSKANDTALLDRVQITQIETVEINGTSYGAVYVDNGGTLFDTSTDYTMYTYQWWTGSTDDVLGNDGGIDPTNDRFPVKLQGIEYMVGCYETIGDAILEFREIDGVECQAPAVCRDASKLATSVTADYKQCAYGVPLPAAAAWQWPKRLGHDADLPEVLWPSVVGASSTTGTRDGSYQEKAGTTGLREWRARGTLNNGLTDAGVSCVNGGYGVGDAYWHIGGRLSVSGNRGEFHAAGAA